MNDIDSVTGLVVDAAFRIHQQLGPGLLEHAYELILAKDLTLSGLHVQRQQSISVEYEGIYIPNAFRADLIVEQAVIVEVKSLISLTALNEKQLLTYIRRKTTGSASCSTSAVQP